MNIKWSSDINGMNSTKYWFIVEPLGTFINIFPHVSEEGAVVFKVTGSQLSDKTKAEYPTLSRAKEVGEALCRFMIEFPLEEIDIDLRDYPEIDLQIYKGDGTQEYKSKLLTGQEFIAPEK